MTRVRTIALVAGVPLATLAATAPVCAAAPPADPAAAPPTDPASAPSSEPPTTGDSEASVPADWVELVDDTNTITVSVPPAWTDVDTAARQDEVTDTEVPSIEASTNREAFVDTFDVAGLWFGALPFDADPEVLADRFGLTSGCANEETVPYDDGVFVGIHVINTECGAPGGAPEFHVVAANPSNQAFTAVLQIQITGPQEQDILDGILASFNMTADVVAASTSSAPTSAAGTVATTVAPTTSAATAPTSATASTTSTTTSS